MKVINRLVSLEEYGIVPLTGEADALSYRILCDLTNTGLRHVCDAYGLVASCFPSAWNRGSEHNPHVGCVMLAHDAWKQIAPVILCQRYGTVFDLRDGHEVIAVCGISGDETFSRAEYDCDGKMVRKAQLNGYDFPDCYGEIGRYYSFGSGPRVGTRMVHAMTGRAV